MKLKYLPLIGILIAFTVACVRKKERNNDKQSGNNYTAKIYNTNGSGYGYDVYKDSLVFIHQPIIPGIQGNQGFSSKQDAQKVADLMIKKLSNNIMPPSITNQELDSLEVLP